MYPVLVRRIFWISSFGLIVFLLAVGVVYVANPLALRTWVLARALKSSSSSIRLAAAEDLIERDPEEAVDVFVDAHANAWVGDSWYADGRSRFALLPPDMAGRLATILDDPDRSRAVAAADGLAILVHSNQGHDFSAVLPALLRSLERRDDTLCTSAAWVICRIAPNDSKTREALLRASREGCPGVLHALKFRELSDAEVNELIGSLAIEDEQLRRQVARLLGTLEAQREASVPALVGLLGDESYWVIHAALWSLERLEQRDPVTISKVYALIEREDVRFDAIQFLARSTAASAEALAAVQAGLGKSSQATEFLDALGNAPPQSISPALIPDLLHLCRAGADLDQRLSAIDVLAGMGPAARSAVPAMKELLADGENADLEQSLRIALESMREAE